MNIDSKLTEYKNNIDTLRAVESLEVYRWLISLGEKLNHDPLSKEKRSEKNKVKSCQFDLFVDYEDGRFKGWSKAMVSAGYAYILIDIFNSLDLPEAKKVTVDHFKKIKMDELLTMSRKTGFYEMIEIMIGKLKNVSN
jgi:sulfur transfer protein SufE|tara:strand:+ start:86 stop:499 length:414 start_codon:yes stop_codon:yes gene_type:complete